MTLAARPDWSDRIPALTSGQAWVVGDHEQTLYRLGGWAAALLAALTVAHAAVFSVAGLPESVGEWFALFTRNGPLGLLAFEGLMVLYVLASIPLALALFAALRPRQPTLALLYVACTVVGAIAFVRARPAFELLALALAHAAAPVGTGAAYVAAGEAALATFHGTSFYVSYAVGSVGGLLLAAAMLRSRTFGAPLAVLRAASSVLDWGLFLPGIGLFVSLASVLCLLVFNVLLARDLLRRA